MWDQKTCARMNKEKDYHLWTLRIVFRIERASLSNIDNFTSSTLFHEFKYLIKNNKFMVDLLYSGLCCLSVRYYTLNDDSGFLIIKDISGTPREVVWTLGMQKIKLNINLSPYLTVACKIIIVTTMIKHTW